MKSTIVYGWNDTDRVKSK